MSKTSAIKVSVCRLLGLSYLKATIIFFSRVPEANSKDINLPKVQLTACRDFDDPSFFYLDWNSCADATTTPAISYTGFSLSYFLVIIQPFL